MPRCAGEFRFVCGDSVGITRQRADLWGFCGPLEAAAGSSAPPRLPTLERQRPKHPALLTVTRDSTVHEPSLTPKLPIRRSAAWCCWAKAAECRLPCYAAPLVLGIGRCGLAYQASGRSGRAGGCGPGQRCTLRWRSYGFYLMFSLGWLETAGAHRRAVGLPRRSRHANAGEGPRVG